MPENDNQELATKSEFNPISKVIASGLAGLPEAISKTAFGAINRLVTGAVDVPVAYLAGFKEAIEDKNFEKRIFRRSLANAAVSKAAMTDELQLRTIERLITDQSWKQRNRESIAKAALAELRETENIVEPETSMDNDWMAKFARYSEDVSHEDVQKLWGKVLAGEILNPGSFRSKSLMLLADMDQKTAELFQLILDSAFGPLVPHHLLGVNGPLLSAARYLEAEGFLSSANGSFEKVLNLNDKSGGLNGQTAHIFIQGNNLPALTLKSVWMTNGAADIAKILPRVNEKNIAKAIVSKIPKGNISSISYHLFEPGTAKIDKTKMPEILYRAE
ncbi:DUF2806 domain-containing protein [Parasphingorhabdus sp.]|uniref:DUF2806 domain-containing protein n=1 Tax=Parasphingorhabdus sp. TaxID=2709688 RepID=UPI002B275F73|nr:DUF2806 domain-containing protein [Parasphingorhabdus sp.]